MARARASREQAADHPTRRAILDHLADGGGTLTDLADGVAVARSTIRHHVRVLLRWGLITEQRTGRVRLLSRPGEQRQALRRHLSRQPVRAKLLDRLEQGPSRLGTLAEQAGTSPANATHHLKRLEEAGLVERAGRGCWRAR